MSRKRFFTAPAAAVVALVLGLGGALVSTTAASAHTPSVTADCETLSVSLSNYTLGAYSVPSNTVTVSIDGQPVVADKVFGTSFSATYPLGDKYAKHDYSVKIVAHDDRDGSLGWSQTVTGTSTPCERPIPAPPAPEFTSVDRDVVDCTTGTVTVFTTRFETVFEFNGSAWVRTGERQVGEEFVSSVRDATSAECEVARSVSGSATTATCDVSTGSLSYAVTVGTADGDRTFLITRLGAGGDADTYYSADGTAGAPGEFIAFATVAAGESAVLSLSGLPAGDYRVVSEGSDAAAPLYRFDTTIADVTDQECAGLQPSALEVIDEWVAAATDCDAREVTLSQTTTTTPYTLSGRAWVLGEPVVSTETQTHPMTDVELEELCPVDIQPSAVQVLGQWTVAGDDCDTATVTEQRTVSTTPFVLVDREWVAGTAVETTDDRSRAMTDAERSETCPTVPVTPTTTTPVTPLGQLPTLALSDPSRLAATGPGTAVAGLGVAGLVGLMAGLVLVLMRRPQTVTDED